MKYDVVQFKSMTAGLKELEPFVRDGQHLLTGRPFARFAGMRSREVLSNWLVCAVVNDFVESDQVHFTSDPIGGDGIIRNKVTGDTTQTEHVMVPRTNDPQELDALILAAVEAKRAKGGDAYASGKTLIVFLDGTGLWTPARIARGLPDDLGFNGAWIIGLQERSAEGEYIYNVADLDAFLGFPVWRISISPGFDKWQVTPVQGVGLLPDGANFVSEPASG